MSTLLLTRVGSSDVEAGGGSPPPSFDTQWVSRATPADFTWAGLRWVPELDLFIAVAYGANNRVMTSPDGITWTQRNSPAVDVEWWAVAYGAGLAVAVARGPSTGNKIMTSPDGITWTSRAAPDNAKRFRDVIYSRERELFVAVGHAGACITSPDGINWTARALPTAIDHDYIGVTYGAGLFVAVANYGADNLRVVTSPDGITWTARTVPARNAWRSVVYADGQFVCVAANTYDYEAPGQLVMTSPDGITWTLRSTPQDQAWERIAWGNGLYAVVSSGGASGSTRAMTSPNGIVWTLETAPHTQWIGCAYANARFASCGFSGVGFRAMTREAFNETSSSPWIIPAQGLGREPLEYGAEASPLVLEGFQV